MQEYTTVMNTRKMNNEEGMDGREKRSTKENKKQRKKYLINERAIKRTKNEELLKKRR